MSIRFLLVNEPPYLLLDVVRLKSGTLLVGRSPSAAICLPDKTISREHAEIVVSDHEISVRDLGSANGTYLNDTRITHAETVQIGQRLRFGRVSFEVTDKETPSRVADIFDVPTDTIRPDEQDAVSMAMGELTTAQRAVFDLAVTGKTPREIAKLRHLSQHTVHNHLRRIYEVFDVHSRSELLMQVLRRQNQQNRP